MSETELEKARKWEENFNKKIEFIKKKYRIVYITIIGHSGSGKTNLAYRFYDLHFKNDGYTLLHYQDYFMTKKTRKGKKRVLALNRIINDIKRVKKPYVILDDLSFLFIHYSKQIVLFLNDLMKIRHYVGRAVIVFIAHYQKSLLPVMRNSQIFLVTSLGYPDFKEFKNWFYADAIKEFLDYQNKYVDKYFVLCRLINDFYAHIFPTGLSETYKNRFLND